MSHAARDAGALQLGWVTKLAVVLAVLGVFGYDGVAIMSARINGEDDAQNAASAASETWQSTHNIQDAYRAAVQAVAGKDEKVLTRDFHIDPDNTAHLLLRRPAATILLQRIGPLRQYTIETVHGDKNYDPV